MYPDNDLTLILMRHGNYSDAPGGGVLNEAGKEEVTQAARFIAAQNLPIDTIWHSEKQRARETAEIIQQILPRSPSLQATTGLLPFDDIQAMAQTLATESGRLMCVTHLPFVERLTGMLLFKFPDQQVIQFHTATMLCLGRQDLDWHMEWLVSPGQLKEN